MRKWRSPEIPSDDEWAVNHEIVVPRIYLSEILSLAHESFRCNQKILNHLY